MGPNKTDRLLHSRGSNKNNNKKNLTEWEKIDSNDATYKCFISKIYKKTYRTL